VVLLGRDDMDSEQQRSALPKLAPDHLGFPASPEMLTVTPQIPVSQTPVGPVKFENMRFAAWVFCKALWVKLEMGST